MKWITEICVLQGWWWQKKLKCVWEGGKLSNISDFNAAVIKMIIIIPLSTCRVRVVPCPSYRPQEQPLMEQGPSLPSALVQRSTWQCTWSRDIALAMESIREASLELLDLQNSYAQRVITVHYDWHTKIRSNRSMARGSTCLHSNTPP